MESGRSGQERTWVNDHGDVVGQYAGLLAGAEVGLGSLLHAWQVPGAGHLLSLSQGFLLSRATQKTRRPKSAIEISMMVSALKSLSPAGKKLTPMLAITVQGLLFALGQTLFGVNPIGTVAGFLFLSTWAFLQPVLISYFIFGPEMIALGQDFFRRAQSILPITGQHLLIALSIVIGMKVLIAVGVAFWSHSPGSERAEATLGRLSGKLNLLTEPANRVPWSHRLVLVGQDLLRPWFIFALLFFSGAILFFWSDWERALLYFFRSIGMGILCFYALRFLPVQRWVRRALKELNFSSRS